LSEWDYGRLRSLLDTAVHALERLVELHGQEDRESAPWDEFWSGTIQAYLDLAAIKALLKRERSRKA
jgi:hypothetical protein